MLSTSRLTLVYAGFAVVVAVFVWTYLGWLILLAGAQLSFYLQNPQTTCGWDTQILRLSGHEQERLALDIMARVAQRHRAGEAPWTIDALSRWLGLPGIAIGDMAEHLERTGLLASADDGKLFPGARDRQHPAGGRSSRARASRSSGHDPHPRCQHPGRAAAAGRNGRRLARGLWRAHAADLIAERGPQA